MLLVFGQFHRFGRFIGQAQAAQHQVGPYVAVLRQVASRTPTMWQKSSGPLRGGGRCRGLGASCGRCRPPPSLHERLPLQAPVHLPGHAGCGRLARRVLADPDLRAARGAGARQRGELDRIEQEQLAFFQRTRQKYLQIAASEANIVVIDASQPVASVQQQLTTALDNALGQ